MAPFASAIFAPMEVPLFNNCFDRTYSFFSSFNNRDKDTILTEKINAFLYKTVSFVNTHNLAMIIVYC